MLSFAPRIAARLREEIELQSRRSVPIAEMNRCVGEAAAAAGLYRPSYEQVRVLVHEARRARRPSRPSVATLAVDVAFRVRPPEALFLHLAASSRAALEDRLFRS
jgi:hypothetical protein